MKIKLSADSTCDLSREVLEKYDITIAPQTVILGGKEYKDSIDITADDIFREVEQSGAACSTTAVNCWEYEELFGRLLTEADWVIHFCISGVIASCYQNACEVAEKMGNVLVVDSRNLSTGIGHLAVLGAELAEQGMEPREIHRLLVAKREKLDVSFVIDTMEYLRRGGRCSALTAYSAELLQMKPSILVKNGAMGVGKKYVGKLSVVLPKYVRDRLRDADQIDRHRVFITHSGVDPAIVEKVKETVLECVPFEEVLETRAGCTVSTHCGPNCLGILFFKK